HGVDDGAGAEEEQRLEERVRENVKDAGGEGSNTERKEHVAELRDGGIGEYALDVVLYEADGGGEDGGQGTNDGDRLHRGGCEHEQSIRTRDHVDTSSDHGGGMDECGNRRGAFHSVGQPDIERELCRLAAGSNEEQQRGRGDDGIADSKMAATRHGRHVGES